MFDEFDALLWLNQICVMQQPFELPFCMNVMVSVALVMLLRGGFKAQTYNTLLVTGG